MKSYYQNKYSVTFKISLILSELLIIFLFLFFPEITSVDNEKIYLDEITNVAQIPQTIQNYFTFREKPSVPEIIFDNLDDEDIILENLNYERYAKTEYFSDKKDDGIKPGMRNRNIIPRQIVEVLPQQSENKIEGTVLIKIKIDANGRVTGHRVISSDINCTDCISQIINAVYQSLWEPAKANGKFTEYWIEKTYRFN